MAITGDISSIKLPNNNEYFLKDKTQTRSDHRHYESDLVPLVSKVYESTSYYATTPDFEGSSWYFMSVRPDDWYKPWSVKLKFYSYCPNYAAYKSFTDSTISGRTGGIIYANWNETTSTTAHCYVTVYPLKKVGYDSGFGHAIAISIYGASDYNKSNYYRTFEVDFLECENCTVTILDTPVKWSNWPGTGTTNYESLQSLNATTRGLQETGDANTVTENRIGYFAGKTGTKGIWASSFFMETSSGTFENICTASDGTVTSSNRTTATTKIANTTGFRVGSPIWYSNTNYNANTNIAGASVVYSSISAIESRYGFNTTLTTNSLTPYVLLYLVGTIHSDGLFYLDTVWWTQTPNDRSKIYILFGGVYDSTTSNCRVTLYEQNKWYRYDGTKLIELVDESTDVNCLGYASGTIAHFEDGAEDVPLKSLTATITPIQEGTGDPSPSNPRPISGTSVLNVEQRGKNILNPNSEIVPHSTYGFFPLCPNNTPLTMTLFDNDTSVDISDVSFGFSLSLTENGAQSEISNGFVWSVNSGTITGRFNNVMGGKYCDQFVFYPKTQTTLEKIFQRFNIVVFVGTTTATTYEPYTGSTYTIPLGQTVYGGTADVVGGVGSKTKAYYDFTNKDTPWDSGAPNEAGFIRFVRTIADKATGYYLLCDKFPTKIGIVPSSPTEEAISGYTSNTSIYIAVSVSRLSGDLTTSAGRRQAFNDWIDANGLEICYELATPADFTFTGQPINSYLGVNNLYTDSGEVLDVEYYKNTNIIETIIALNTKVSISVSDTTLNIITQ